MSVEADNQRQAFSRDAALIALAHARDQIGFPDDRLRSDASVGRDTASKTSGAGEASQSALRTNSVRPAGGTPQGGLPMWRLLGLGVLVPIGVVILGWHFLYRAAEVAPVSTSTVKELAAKTATPSPTSDRAAPHADTELVASVGSPRVNLDRSVASLAHQLADSAEEIEELKSRQAQILLDNSELDRRLKQAEELARGHADLIKELKSTQQQLAQDSADLAAQVKASQEQVTNLAAQLDAGQAQVAKIAAKTRAIQDQNARPVDQKQHSQLSIPALPRVNSPTKKLAPKPASKRAQPRTEDPTNRTP